MRFIIQAISLLLLCPGPSSSARQGYEGLQKKLKEVFSERSGILQQLSKTSKELDSIKGNLQVLKGEDPVAKQAIQRVLELSSKQRKEMKSLQAALQKQLEEAREREEKQQATIKYLKTEMEKKTKVIKDLQQENKSLKNKLLSGNKLCDVHTEEGQQLMDLEHRLTIAKEQLEKTALDKESQLKALKDTVHICFSAVLQNQHNGGSHRFPASSAQLFRYSPLINSSRVTYQQPHAKDISKVRRLVKPSQAPGDTGVTRRENGSLPACQMEKTGRDGFPNQTKEAILESRTLPESHQQRSPTQIGHITTALPDDRKEVDEDGTKKDTAT
uniref:Leucine zipper protein 2 n=1 Tax=Gadus morhua TaxID=8049 RepID=A0A8C5BSH6_GADMO